MAAADNLAFSPTPPAPRRIRRVNWIGVWTLYKKEVWRFIKVINQTVAAPVVTTLLFLAVFTLALGRDVQLGAGISFPMFLAPGLVMMSLLQNAFANTSSSIVGSKMQGNIVDLLMPPLGPGELTAAFALGAITRGLVVGTVTAVTMALVVGFAMPSPLLALYFAVMGALFFGLLGVVAGIWAEKFDHLSAVTNFAVTPLTFLSGTFYSIDRLPGLWNSIAHLNPVFWLIDGFRAGMIGWSDSTPWIGGVAIAGLDLALFALCWRLFATGWKLKA
ncbi:ABC transporter permease [Thalassobaculum sp.]|uniref:ABC transporter permease n=1 Tax=Thalassobaculum sp. TaxID=2022740 RepID=UPI0032EB2A23